MRRRPQRSCALAGLSRARWFPTAIVCLALLPSPPPAGAQHRLDSWTTENGLPQNSVNDILQTRDGYLWLATHGGLVRFDGLRFVVFDRSTPGIGSQRLRALHQDREGTLWAGNRGRDADSVSGQAFRHLYGQGRTAARRRSPDRRGRRRLPVGDLGRPDHEVRRPAFRKLRGSRLWQSCRRPAGCPLRRRLVVPGCGRSARFVKGRRADVFRMRSVGTQIKRVKVDLRGNVWISTYDAGLIKVSGDTIRRYTTRDGLPSDTSGRALRRRLLARTSGSWTEAAFTASEMAGPNCSLSRAHPSPDGAAFTWTMRDRRGWGRLRRVCTASWIRPSRSMPNEMDFPCTGRIRFSRTGRARSGSGMEAWPGMRTGVGHRSGRRPPSSKAWSRRSTRTGLTGCGSARATEPGISNRVDTAPYADSPAS